MPKFSKKSIAKLDTCHPKLKELCERVIEITDFTVTEGHRDKETQDLLQREGKSQLRWPHSMHNSQPSMAVDLYPYPVDFYGTKRFGYLAGLMIATAHSMGMKIRWGGDWDMDGNLKDQNFHDLPHFELVDIGE